MSACGVRIGIAPRHILKTAGGVLCTKITHKCMSTACTGYKIQPLVGGSLANSHVTWQ